MAKKHKKLPSLQRVKFMTVFLRFVFNFMKFKVFPFKILSFYPDISSISNNYCGQKNPATQFTHFSSFFYPDLLFFFHLNKYD